MSAAHEPYLVIEASTAFGSVALVHYGVVHAIDAPLGVSREDALFPCIVQLLADAQLDVTDLCAIVCGAGPGSFTSLRIAAALAKGLAHATGCPIYAVSSLLLAGAMHDAPGRYVVHADALRGERFALAVERAPNGVTRADGDVQRVTVSALHAMLEGRRSLTVGERLAALGDSDVIMPHASGIVRVDQRWHNGPVSLVTWEPTYGRLAEAQVQWEVVHGRALPTA